MHSPLARQSEQALIDAAKCLSPEQRLNAFLTHSRLMLELFREGEKIRERMRAVKNPA
jgi:hypothetical protein